MGYFKLGQDRRRPYAVLMTGLGKIGGYHAAKAGDLDALQSPVAAFVDPSQFNFYPDILDRQIYMVKGAVKDVFDLFMPDFQV